MLQEITRLLSEKGYAVGEPYSSDNKVFCSDVSRDNLTVTVWDAGSYFGFNLVDGGAKKFNDLDKFGVFIDMYFTINTDYIPKCKKVAEDFESAISATTIYDKFVGNKVEGYTFIFAVVGSANTVVKILYHSDEDIRASYYAVNANKEVTSKWLEYLYCIQDGSVVRKNNVYSVYTELKKTNPYLDGLDLVVEDNKLLLAVNYEGIITNLDVKETVGDVYFIYENIEYLCESLPDFKPIHIFADDEVAQDSSEDDDEMADMFAESSDFENRDSTSELDNSNNEAQFSGEDSAVSELTEETTVVVAQEEVPVDDEVGIGDDEALDEVVEPEDASADEYFSEDIKSEETESEYEPEPVPETTGVPVVEDTVAEEAVASEPVSLDKEDKEIEKMDSCMLKDEKGKVFAVDIYTREGLLRASVDFLKKAGIPLRVFCNSEVLSQSNGMLLSTIEKERKTFAEEVGVDSDVPKYKEIIWQTIFN